MGKIVEVNEQVVRDQPGSLVCSSGEDSLNSLLDAEADRLCNAQRHEHSAERVDSRAASISRRQGVEKDPTCQFYTTGTICGQA